MAEVVWTIPALNDFERILEYIALDNPEAANDLARDVFKAVDRLEKFPESGSKPKELKGTRYRRLVVGPVLIYYRKEEAKVFIVYVCRGERRFDVKVIKASDKV